MNGNHNAIHILTTNEGTEQMKARVSAGGGLHYWAHTSTEGFLLLQRQVMRIHPPTAAELFKILKAINCLMFYFARTAIIDSVIYLLPQPRSFWCSLMKYKPESSGDFRIGSSWRQFSHLMHTHTPLHTSSCILRLHNWSDILFFSFSPWNRQLASNRVRQKSSEEPTQHLPKGL